MILSEKVMVNASAAGNKYWEKLGYELPKRIDTRGVIRVEKGAEIEVLVKDLSIGSHTKVDVRCDYCGFEYVSEYRAVIKHRENVAKDCCKKCQGTKRQEVMMLRYGVEHAMHSDEFKNKMKQTNIEKYGYENVGQNKEIKNKIKQILLDKYGVEHYSKTEEYKEKTKKTNLERYGFENAMHNDVIKQRMVNTNLERYGVKYYFNAENFADQTIDTNLERYGVEYSAQSEIVKEKMRHTLFENYGVEHPMFCQEIKDRIKETCLDRYGFESYTQTEEYKEKTKNTNMERYGVEWALQSSEVREKGAKTLFSMGKIPCSKQQFHLHSLFGGVVNYSISKYWADIALLEDSIVIEYDGGGHDLQVKCGNVSQEDFDIKQNIRDLKILERGFNVFRIISPKDKTLTDDEYVKIFEFVKSCFSEGENFVNLYVDERCVKLKDKTVGLDEILK